MREQERELERLRDDLSQLQYELNRLRDAIRERDRIIEVHNMIFGTGTHCGYCYYYLGVEETAERERG